MRGPQDLARAKNLPIYVCFIHLQKKYGSVDRYPPWKLLAQYGVPAKVVSTITLVP